MNVEVPEELIDKIEELSAYYELDSLEWPIDAVYSGGVFHRGVISDEVYSILISILELVEGHRR